jgi:2-iminobutanoate/2-iminopropanoate deaminase
VGLDADGRLAEGVEAQTRQVLANIAAVLADCGTDWGHVAKVGIFLTDLGSFSVVNGLYQDAIGLHRPARSTVGVAALPAGAEVEIECWVHHPA